MEELKRRLADVNLRIGLYDDPLGNAVKIADTGSMETLLFYRGWFEGMIERGTHSTRMLKS